MNQKLLNVFWLVFLLMFIAAVSYGGYGVQHIFDQLTDLFYFGSVTRHEVSSMGRDGLDGDDTQLYPLYGTTALTVCQGNDARIPTTDEKAAMTGANSPSAANVFATMDDTSSADTGVQTITAGVNLTNSGTEKQPILDVDDAFLVNDAEDTGIKLNLTEGMNIATGQTYKVNHIQISSANLSDESSIGMLDEAEAMLAKWDFSSYQMTDSDVADTLTIVAAGSVDAEAIADGSVTNTEFQYINTVSSNVQTQLDDKVAQADSALHYHNDHYGLQGGTAGEYYHLTASKYGIVDASVADSYLDAGQKANIDLNTTHRSSDGSDHTYIDQSVISGASPTFTGANFTAMDADDVNIADDSGIITATNVEIALQENRTAIDLNTAKATNVSTALSEGTRDDTTYGITSDGGVDDILLPQATTNYAGLLSGTKFDEIVANTTDRHASASDNQNLWEEIRTDTGTTSANSQTDTLWIVGLGDISTYSDGDTISIAYEGSAGAGDMTKAVYDPNDDGKIAEAQLKLDIGTMTLWKNTQFNAFRIGNYAKMIDGFTNDFTVEDEGIDTVLSDTYLYDATGDYYYQDAGTGATTEVDYMEYDSDDSAQANYVSSKKAQSGLQFWSKLNSATDVTSPQIGSAGAEFGSPTYVAAKFDSGVLSDANSEGITIPTAANNINIDKGTVEFWAKLNFAPTDADNHYLFSFLNYAAGYGGVRIAFLASIDDFEADVYEGTTQKAIATTAGVTWSAGDIKHFAVVWDRGGTDIDGTKTLVIYIDGVEVASSTVIWATSSVNANMYVGTDRSQLSHSDAVIDNIKTYNICKTDFSDREIETGYALQSYSESTIKTQGTYAFKGIAAKDSSLADTMYHVFDPVIDLTGKTSIKLDTRATITGQNYSVKIHDSGGTTTTHAVTVADTDVYQTDSWDISAVADADKDAIDKILIEMDLADTRNTFYLDNVYATLPATGGGNMELYTEYYQIGITPVTVKAMILSNAQPDTVKLTRLGTGTTLTTATLSDSDIYNATYYSWNYTADVSGETSDTCIRCEIVQDDTTTHFYAISILGLE